MGILPGFVNTFVTRAILALVWVYRWTLAPIFISLGAQCRFHPSCSEYALEAVRVHGPWRGGLLAVFRVGRCHPFCDGGVDMVPQLEGHK